MTISFFSMFSWVLWVGLFASISLTADFKAGQKFQIVLSSVPDVTKTPIVPTDAPVFDIDLFDSNATTIATLKAQGKIVICYFSAGTFEPWRDDASKFQNADKGKALPEWPDEKWIKVGSASVRSIMTSRIQLAATKGCDAIDPDNVDGYQNDNGLNLQAKDLIDYMGFLSTTATGLGMQTGLKNALDILPNVQNEVAFAVNEQCAINNECTAYSDFLKSGKPVFHIEYPAKIPQVSAADKKTDCQSAGVDGMSTVMKNLTLSGLTVYCDGSTVTTPTIDGTGSKPWGGGPGGGNPRPPRSSTSRSIPPRTSTTSRTTTTRPTSIPTPTRSTLITTSTTQPGPSQPTDGGGNGCKAKHWDQCGGQNWKGCTSCEAGLTCKGVSPPYYYQCL